MMCGEVRQEIDLPPDLINHGGALQGEMQDVFELLGLLVFKRFFEALIMFWISLLHSMDDWKEAFDDRPECVALGWAGILREVQKKGRESDEECHKIDREEHDTSGRIGEREGASWGPPELEKREKQLNTEIKVR